MELNVLKFDYKHILLDEIALDGLEGTGVDLLWRRIGKHISSSVTEKMKTRFWNFIINCESIKLYQLPEPIVHVEVIDRFTLIDNETGHLIDPDDYVDGPYEYCPVESEYGSCVHYKTRTLLPKHHFQMLPYEKVIAEYGDTLVLVASIEARWQALAPHMSITHLKQLTPVHYCILELIGRARENGQMTVGKTNLTKIVKDPKLLFYNRKQLQKLDLVRVQHITQISSKGNKSLLLRLKRYHQPSVLSMPKVGKLHDVVEYLLAQPGYSEKTDVIIKKGMLAQQQIKRLQKTINIFSFDEKLVKTENNQNKKTKNPSVTVKKKFISLTSKSDESSQSDDETSEPLHKYQTKVGENLLRQAYERFLETGLKGLTQIEIAQLLGIEYYTSRTICRKFKSRNIIRQFLEDKGRQRTARYIAVAATGEMDVKYAKEKRKFLEYLDDTIKLNKSEMQISTSEDASGSVETPRKKIKYENNVGKIEKESDDMEVESMENKITEIKVIDGLENSNNESLLHSKKNLTLRQLRFANGVLKVTREKLCVSGYQTLSTLVSKEICEPPMDTKALKSFVQKLVTDGQLKILKLMWPGFQQKYSVLICAPYVKRTDPIIKAMYKEICIKAYSNKKLKMKKDMTENVSRPLSQFAYPRYMKIQKLHELLVKFVYFNDVKFESFDMPKGFTSLINVIPEITVEFAVGNISNMAISDVCHLKISDNILDLKLRDAPDDLYKVLLQSKSLNNSLKINLKVLAMLGLVQLVSQPSQNVDHCSSILNSVFFVNRHAKIIDTTGVWPRKDADLSILEKKFYFETFDDVKDYWSVVYDVSTNTTIQLPSRGRKNLSPPTRLESEVPSFDNGDCYGDGLGPCGFDSGFYMDIPRLWRAFYVRATRMKQAELERKSRIKIPKLRVTKKQKSLPKIKKKNMNRINKQETFYENIRPKRQNDSSIKWSQWDDKIIMMCKAAITIMSPSSQPGYLKVRNLVAKDLLSITDPKKTGSVCHRRAITLESNSTLSHEMECLLNELRRRGHLIHKYESLLRKLRIRHSTNMTKFMNEARLPMLELVWLISQISKSNFLSQRVPCVAMNFEDFHRNFTVSSSCTNKSYNIYKMPDCETEIATLKEGILLTVMLNFNNVMVSDVATKIYSIFKACPEEMLRTALEQLRKCGAVVAKDKLLNYHMHKFNLKDMVQSSYKISAFYRRKWTNRLNSEFADSLGECLEKELIQNSIKGAPEINCLYCELQSCNILEIIFITVPVITGSSGSIIQEEQLNVIDIEMKYKLKSGTLGWKNKSNIKVFSELYQNLEYEEFLKSLSRNAVVDFASYQDVDVDDKIIIYLKEKSEKGCTFSELRDLRGYNEKYLIDRLHQLESMNILKRVGYYENRIVLTQFLPPWSMDVEGKFLLPAPWLTLDADIRYNIFLKWAGMIMNKVFENPGCSVSYLADSSEFLNTRGVQDLSMFLEKCQCVTLHTMKTSEADLFSDDNDIPELSDFNPYESPENILVFPVKDSLTKYAYVRKKILEKYYNND